MVYFTSKEQKIAKENSTKPRMNRRLFRIAAFQFQPMVGDVYESGMCTLPRQHWPNQSSVQSMSMTMSPPMLYTSLGVVSRPCPAGGTLLKKDCDTRVPGQCCPAIQSQKETTIGTPVMVTKRESSV